LIAGLYNLVGVVPVCLRRVNKPARNPSSALALCYH